MSISEFKAFETRLRKKWREIPATRMERQFSSDLLDYSDKQLIEYWEECKSQTVLENVRGWYQKVYQYQVRNKKMLELGAGLGIDGIFFAENGAHLTFADIVEDNLTLLRRICKLKGISADFYFIDDFFHFNFSHFFDLILAVGSLINVPLEFAKKEFHALSPWLLQGGRLLMLAYPYERFIASGTSSGEDFAKTTDGERTPWIEWYDQSKVMQLVGPEFSINWWRNFGTDNIEFNWFELSKLSYRGLTEIQQLC